MEYHQASCDGCHKSIYDVRWKCVNCLSYDLCDTCEKALGNQKDNKKDNKKDKDLDQKDEDSDNENSKHPETHLFKKITKPLPNYGLHRVLPDFYDVPKETPKAEWYLKDEERCDPLVCPLCVDGGKMTCDMVGRCGKCGREMGSASFKCCAQCSWELEMCYFCESPIREGSFYVDKLDKKIQSLADKVTKEITDESPMKEYYQSMKPYYQSVHDELVKVKADIQNKSKFEVMQSCKAKVSRVF